MAFFFFKGFRVWGFRGLGGSLNKSQTVGKRVQLFVKGLLGSLGFGAPSIDVRRSGAAAAQLTLPSFPKGPRDPNNHVLGLRIVIFVG